jgi:hypothetical protein
MVPQAGRPFERRLVHVRGFADHLAEGVHRVDCVSLGFGEEGGSKEEVFGMSAADVAYHVKRRSVARNSTDVGRPGYGHGKIISHGPPVVNSFRSPHLLTIDRILDSVAVSREGRSRNEDTRRA